MRHTEEGRLRAESLTPADIQRLGNPLAVFKEDHYQLRHVCALLDSISGLPSKEPGDLASARDFLRHDFPVHLADEEEDFYPLLRKRCAPEDEIDSTLDQLSADHLAEIRDAQSCVAILEKLDLGQINLNPKDAKLLRKFAKEKRRHLIVENAILIPLARARLLTSDLNDILANMLHRRGLAP